jgi:hypothetical protein
VLLAAALALAAAAAGCQTSTRGASAAGLPRGSELSEGGTITYFDPRPQRGSLLQAQRRRTAPRPTRLTITSSGDDTVASGGPYAVSTGVIEDSGAQAQGTNRETLAEILRDMREQDPVRRVPPHRFEEVWDSLVEVGLGELPRLEGREPPAGRPWISLEAPGGRRWYFLRGEGVADSETVREQQKAWHGCVIAIQNWYSSSF